MSSGNCDVEGSILKLIDRAISLSKSKKVVFIGSSKGGYGALNIGCRYPNSNIIVGAPQYLLGNYLVDSHMQPQIDFLLTDNPRYANQEELNGNLRNKIFKYRNNIDRLFLHYSDAEHTFGEHIQYLLKDIDKLGIDCECDICHYAKHNDVAYFFPKFLLDSLRKLGV